MRLLQSFSPRSVFQALAILSGFGHLDTERGGEIPDQSLRLIERATFRNGARTSASTMPSRQPY